MALGKDESDGAKLGLPLTSFLYRIDQICQLVGVDQDQALRTMFYFWGRSTGKQSPHTMMARDIASGDADPDWRVAEHEFIRWLKVKGFIIDQMLTIRR